MKKQHWLVLLFFSFLCLSGCKEEVIVPEGYYQYEKTKVEEAIEHISFTPDVPQYVPIPVEFIISDPFTIAGTDYEALDISFYSRGNDLLTFQVTEGQFDISDDAEDVEIDSSIAAYYIDNGFAKILTWTKNGLSYKLEFRSSVIGDHQSSRQVSKEELIKVVQSTHS